MARKALFVTNWIDKDPNDPGRIAMGVRAIVFFPVYKIIDLEASVDKEINNLATAQADAVKAALIAAGETFQASDTVAKM